MGSSKLEQKDMDSEGPGKIPMESSIARKFEIAIVSKQALEPQQAHLSAPLSIFPDNNGGAPFGSTEIQEGEQCSGEVQHASSKRSKLKAWTKKALHGVKHQHADTSATSKSTTKTGWKLRSPLARRSPPKENPHQTVEIAILRQALKDHATAEPDQELDPVQFEKMKLEVVRLEEYKAAATRLAQEKLKTQPKLNALQVENQKLKSERQHLDALVEVGKAVRLRVYESYEIEVNPRSNGNALVIKNGNKAAHNGNVAADAALFFLKAIDRARHIKAFDSIYRIGAPENYRDSFVAANATELLNYRGTVELSVHYPDRSAYEKFLTLENKWRALISVRSILLAKALRPSLSSESEMKSAFLQLERLAVQICNTAKKGKISGHLRQSAKQLEKRNKKGDRKKSPTASESNPDETMAVVQEGVKPKKKKNHKNKNQGSVAATEDTLSETQLKLLKAGGENSAKAKKKLGMEKMGDDIIGVVEEKIESSYQRVDILYLSMAEVEIHHIFNTFSNFFRYLG